MKKEGSKREHGPTFCFDFWVRFGDHRALYHIPIVIILTLKNIMLQIQVLKIFCLLKGSNQNRLKIGQS